MTENDPLDLFHPAVAAWFRGAFAAPSPAQRDAWPAIKAGSHTLIAAPTGSGKTLAAFLAAIDDLVRSAEAGELPDATRVVYVSPLKALSNDIERNLQAPLQGILAQLRGSLPADAAAPPEIRAGLRTGDTPAAARTAMTRRPPHILVTTPESLYLLLTSAGGRAMLGTTRTVIVDEIHAILGTKRGAHLALSLERLDSLTAAPVTRIGLSATQKPLATAAAFLTGTGRGTGSGKGTGGAAAFDAGSGAGAGMAAADRAGFGASAGAADGTGFGRVATTAAAIDAGTGAGSGAGAGTAAADRAGFGRVATTAAAIDAGPGAGEAAARGGAGSTTGAISGTAGHPPPACAIVDTGHRREMEVALELPGSPLETVMANEVWEELYQQLTDLILDHRTTLIFVNTRRLAERMSHALGTVLGEEQVAAHHGSLSKEQRLDAEQRLKGGKLRAIVATASLELGIDIGVVDLVCQFGSPKSIMALLQRVGRSGHHIAGTPKGRLFPLTRDELVECTALLMAVQAGELDRIEVPLQPLDILAQQIVAEASAAEWQTDDLFAAYRRAYPYRELRREQFDTVVEMLASGFTTARGRRGAYLHHDAIGGRVRGRRGAGLAALTNGGAIPDNFDYQVRVDPQDLFIGTVHEDFAIESMPGDTFLLGNRSWEIRKVETGVVRVVDAAGKPPTLPFWVGEAPGRSDELSRAVSALRAQVRDLIRGGSAGPRVGGRAGGRAGGTGDGTAGRGGAGDRAAASDGAAAPDRAAASDRAAAPDGAAASDGQDQAAAVRWLVQQGRLDPAAADQVVSYLHAGMNALDAMPTHDTAVMERFFDEAGDMHLVIHSPRGSRLNRAWGLALRKRFCRNFNFELQAAANEDSLVLSLGQTHSFALAEVWRYLNHKTVRAVLVQALLDAPMFQTRWRWNATRALAVLRQRGGKRVPPYLQRMQSEDLLALVFPDQLACLENIAGEREIPDHPLVAQAIEDCLTEAMDIAYLEQLLAEMEAGTVELVTRDLREPSPFAQEIINARPYAFLDDAPLEERRTQAIRNRRWITPEEARQFGALDADAIARVRAEALPRVEDADELHDALTLLTFIDQREGEQAGWQALFATLVQQGRATRIVTGADPATRWVAAERLPLWHALDPEARLDPPLTLPPAVVGGPWQRAAALREVVRGRLEAAGPVGAATLAHQIGVGQVEIEAALVALETEGAVLRGEFTDGGGEEWCERRLLARIHRYTLGRLRREIEPLAFDDYLRFLFVWQGVAPVGGSQQPDGAPEEAAVAAGSGPEALLAVIQQLAGYEAPAAAWEEWILPARLANYDPAWLDLLCASGEVAWARLRAPAGNRPGGRTAPLSSSPIALLPRDEMALWRGSAPLPTEVAVAAAPAAADAGAAAVAGAAAAAGAAHAAAPAAAPAAVAAAGPAAVAATVAAAGPAAVAAHAAAPAAVAAASPAGTAGHATAAGHGAAAAAAHPAAPAAAAGASPAGTAGHATAAGHGVAVAAAHPAAPAAAAGASPAAAAGPAGTAVSAHAAGLARAAAPAAAAGTAGTVAPAAIVPAAAAAGPVLSAAAALVSACLAERGALFRDEIQRTTNLLPAQVDAALGELAATGSATCDSFAGLRALIRPAARHSAVRRLERSRRRLPGRAGESIGLAGRAGEASGLPRDGRATTGLPHRPLNRSGRWSLLPAPADAAAHDLEAVALGLLHRYGVMFRRLLERETLAPTWRELVVVYRRLEARGQIRGGYFVSGVGGEQFALAEAVASMRTVRRSPPAAELRVLAAVDPAGVVGIKLRPTRERQPLAGVRGNRILFRDGVPVAVCEAGEIRFLDGAAAPLPTADQWELQRLLQLRAHAHAHAHPAHRRRPAASRSRPLPRC